jgi:hypothetical protein
MQTDSAIASFIENFPIPASLKEADTGKYVLNNVHNSQQFGIANPQDLVGLTINDVRFRQQEWGIQYARAIEKLDHFARETKSHATDRHQFLDDSGEAQLEEMVKFPVLSSRKKVLGIVTYRNDITQTLSTMELYQLYRNFYKPNDAIMRVMIRTGINQYFISPPTETQFRVLILKSDRRSNKEIAITLNMSVRTVECHIDALRNKLFDGNLQRLKTLNQKNASCPHESILY